MAVTNQEVLNTLFVIGFLIVTVCIVFVTYFLVKALKSIINLTKSLEETTENIKGKLQLKVLSFLPALLIAFLSRIIKRRR